MTQATILKVPYNEYKKKTIIRLIICIAILLAVIAVNITLICTVTRNLKVAFTVINIISDIACGWFLLYYSINVLAVRYRLLKIYQKAREIPAEINGKIVGVSSAQKVFKFDCVTVEVETEEGTRKIFAIKDSLDILGVGRTARIVLADNVAIGCEVEDE